MPLADFWGVNSGWADNGDGCELFVLGWESGVEPETIQSVQTLVDMDGTAILSLQPEITVNSLLENIDSNTWLFEKTEVHINSILEDMLNNTEAKAFFGLQSNTTLQDMTSDVDLLVSILLQSNVTLEDIGSATQIDQIPGIFSNTTLQHMSSETLLKLFKARFEFRRQDRATGVVRADSFRRVGTPGRPGFSNANRRGRFRRR